MYGSKSAPASFVMVMYLPHEVFKHILSFKDPARQVGVKGGVQAPSCVWYTWKERWTAPVGGLILKYRQDGLTVNVYKKSKNVRGRTFFLRIRRFSLETVRFNDRMMNDYMEPHNSDVDGTCSTRICELALQCEPCGVV